MFFLFDRKFIYPEMEETIYNRRADLKALPCLDEGHWLFGGGALFAADPLRFITTYVPRYEGIFRVRTARFLEQIVIVSKPEYIKHILQDNNKNYQKSHGYKIMKLLVGNGLLTSEGEFWRRQRRLAQPAFHREKLTTFVDIMVREAAHLVEKWQRLPAGTVVNISREMMEVTLKIVCKSLFSSDVEDAIKVVSREFYIANESLVRRITSPLKIPLWIPTPSNIREKRSYSAIQEVVQQLIEKRRKSGRHYDDLLSLLMHARDEETGEHMNDEQLKDEAVTMFLAGHETTAVALTWLFHCLEENPDVAQKLRAEINQVLGNRLPQLQDLQLLEYTRMVIEETLRLFPPAWIIGRNAIDDDVIDGYHIPKGINLLIPVYQIHRDSRYWENPTQFKPERFSRDKIKHYHKFVYMPFGGGPRLCIGNNFALMEMQILIPVIISRFVLRKPSHFRFRQDPLITMRPQPDMQMEIYPQ